MSRDKAFLKSNFVYSRPFHIVRKCLVIVQKWPDEIDEWLFVRWSCWGCSIRVGSRRRWFIHAKRSLLKEMDKWGVLGKRWWGKTAKIVENTGLSSDYVKRNTKSHSDKSTSIGTTNRARWWSAGFVGVGTGRWRKIFTRAVLPCKSEFFSEEKAQFAVLGCARMAIVKYC